MRTRSEVKKAWFSMKIMLSLGTITTAERKALLKAKDRFQEKLCEVDVSEAEETEEILLRREHVNNNYDMKKVFEMLWGLVSRDVNDGILSEDGYIKFSKNVLRALIGDALTPAEVRKMVKSEYINDRNCFGPLTKLAFFDILAELVGMWADITHVRYAGSFMWSLWESLVDMSCGYPPRFRTWKCIKCISNKEEAQVLSRYAAAQNERALLGFWADWLRSVDADAETVGRHIGRRHAVCMEQPSADMIKILSRYVDKQYLSPEEDDDGDVHSIYQYGSDSPRRAMGMFEHNSDAVINEDDEEEDDEGDEDYEDYEDEDGIIQRRKKKRYIDLTLPEISQKSVLNCPAAGLTIASRLIGKANEARRKSQAIMALNNPDKPVAVMAWLKTVNKLVSVIALRRGNTGTSVIDEDAEASSPTEPPESSFSISAEATHPPPLLPGTIGVDVYGCAKYTSLMDLMKDRRKVDAQESLRLFMKSRGIDSPVSDEDDDILSSFHGVRENGRSPGRPLPGMRRGIFLSDSRTSPSSGYVIRPDGTSKYKYVLDDYDDEQVALLPSYPMPVYRFPERLYAGKPGTPYSALGSVKTTSLSTLLPPTSPPRSSPLLCGSPADKSRPNSPSYLSRGRDDALSTDGGSTTKSWMRIVDPVGTSFEKVHDNGSSTLSHVDTTSIGDCDSILSHDRSIKSITIVPKPIAAGHIAIDKYYETRTACIDTRLEVSRQSLLSAHRASLHARHLPHPNRRSPNRRRPATAPAFISDVERSEAEDSDHSVQSTALTALTGSMHLEDSAFLEAVLCNRSSDHISPSAENSDRVISISVPDQNELRRDPSLDLHSVDYECSTLQGGKKTVSESNKKLPRYMHPVGKIRPATVEGVRRHYKMVTYHTDGHEPAITGPIEGSRITS